MDFLLVADVFIIFSSANNRQEAPQEDTDSQSVMRSGKPENVFVEEIAQIDNTHLRKRVNMAKYSSKITRAM